MLTAKEAFIVGFLKKCAADGMTVPQIRESVKNAFDKLALFGDLIKATSNLATSAMPLAIAAPPILGAIGGYGLSRMTDVDDTDVEDVKNKELMEAYRLEAAKLRRGKAFRDYNQQKNRQVRYRG